jgi:hypothetical protein
MEQGEAMGLARARGIKEIRVLDFKRSTYTTDFRPDRLDLLVEDGFIVKATFF